MGSPYKPFTKQNSDSAQTHPIMAKASFSGYFKILTFLILCFKTISADSNASFFFKRFDKDPNFDSSIALYGDAKVVGERASVQLTASVSKSAGRIMYRKPMKLVEGKPRQLASFSTYFSFSMSHDKGDGLAFVMVTNGFDANVFGNSSFGFPVEFGISDSRIIAIEFDSFKDARYADLNENHVGIDVGSLKSVKVRNASSINNMILNSGERLHSWIDYESGSRRLEVRLSKSGDRKPVDPLLSYPIDLAKMWQDSEEVLVGLSSASGNSSQTCFLYSWSFNLRHIPHWMHSQPLDPEAFTKKLNPLGIHKSSVCILKMLAAMIFGAACGALGAFVVLYLWTVFGNRRPVVPEEFAAHHVDFDFKKVKVVVDKAIKDGKKVSA
ncbi:lectin-like protein [Tripterygium wilfordii]|uniref:Lectin-like protein n=1 Tax=Tripterygium wilfordii TaxID=458696 RepID=A0A7J7DX32_TRIWF|nr:L-type lectin-domain containing receptor kinase VIII.2-like [Tripterygium wilfordii]KAF5750877.1 lectin-like protein [Tripterygium wilfordii]